MTDVPQVESIVAEGVTKEFSRHFHRTIKQMVMAKTRGQEIRRTFRAVDDVSFTVQQGECIGLMGLNGSGKSTLLRMVSGVMAPDEGRMLVRGRIAGLIATKAGFHPQLSGRENIYMNAAVLGMSREETDAKFDDIAGFADVGDALDSPVGNYSSGQTARLGFAVAVNVDCDIFISDEALAVGDRPFKRKCMKKMREIRDSGVTMFYVSHSPGSVRKICDRVLVLEQGRLVFDGDVEPGIKFLLGDDDGADDDALDDEV